MFETTTNEFLSSDRHVIKDIVILPLLFFGFPYLFKIRQIKYPAYYQHEMIDLTQYFVTNNIFGISLHVHACLAIILFKQTRDHGKTFSQKNVICY